MGRIQSACAIFKNRWNFFSIDPILFDKSMNQYTFVENNPGTYNDPMGDMAHFPIIKNCSKFKENDVSFYDSMAEKTIGPARKYTHKRNKVYRNCRKKDFRKWFGCRGSHFKNRRHWAHVERIIRRINNELKNFKRYYKCKNEDGPRASAFSIRRYIWFYDPFWETWDQYKYQVNTHTLIHETSHKKGAVLLTKYEEYGSKACQQKAKKDPKRAKENADSYAEFIDEQYYGRTYSYHD